MKNTFSRMLENNQFVKLISLLVAIAIWFGVVNGIDANASRTIRDIPVQINVAGSAVGKLGLKALLEKELLADVVVSGERNVIGKIKKEDISIEPQLIGIVGPGVYELRLNAYDANSMGFEIQSIRTPTTQVRFDRMTTKKLTLKVDVAGITIPDGYVMGQEHVSPTEITISGPETEMALVESCVAKANIKGALDKNTSIASTIQLQNAQGGVVESPFIEIDNPNASITIPVLKKKTLPVTVGFINAPAGWKSDTVSYTFSHSTIEIAGPSDSIDTMTEIHLGYIDTRNLSIGDTYTLPVTLPSGYMTVESIPNVVVNFSDVGIIKKAVNISSISLINQPAKYEITLSTKSISEVQLIGPATTLENLSTDDLVAEIDFSNETIRVGQVTVPVNIIISNNNNVWVYGEYVAVVVVKEKK